MRYLALVHKDPDTDYGVSFPDLPGCISAGETADEAVAQASVALGLHLSGYAQDGEQAPAPRSIEELQADPEFLEDASDAAFKILVAPAITSGVNTRVNLSVDTGALARIDNAANKAGVSRSRFMVAAALESA